MPYTPENNPYVPGDPFMYNLKWIVKKIKEYANYAGEIADLKTAFEDLKNYVDSFIDSLDIQSAVNAKLEEMLDDGTLANLLFSTFSNASVKLVTVDCKNRAACNILIDNDGNYILIDFGDEYSAPYVVQSITDNGGIVCKAIILTHADHDHIGDYTNIIPALTLSNDFVFYTQERPVSGVVDPAILLAYDNIVAYMANYGTVENNIDKNTVYTLNTWKTIFYNTDTLYYYTLGADYRYNDTSLCGNINIGSSNISFWGDCYILAQNYICDNYEVRNANIMIAPHHAIIENMSLNMLEKVHAKIIIANTGSQSAEVDDFGYNCALMPYCNMNAAALYNTSSDDIIMNVYYDGTVKTYTEPINYNYIFKHYSGVRSIVAFSDDASPDANTSLQDILFSMPVNSELSFFAITGYQILTDLGISGTTFIYIKKFTGGSTNNLIDRTVPAAFYFEIQIFRAYDSEIKQTAFGYYDGSVFKIYNELSPATALLSLAVNGTITQPATVNWLTATTGNIQVNRTGYYRIIISNTTSGPTDVSIGGTSYNVPAGSSIMYWKSLTANTNIALSTNYHAVNISIDFLKFGQATINP